MSKRDTMESKMLAYFETCTEDIGTMVFGLIQAVARRRGLTGRQITKAARRRKTLAAVKPNGKVVDSNLALAAGAPEHGDWGTRPCTFCWHVDAAHHPECEVDGCDCVQFEALEEFDAEGLELNG